MVSLWKKFREEIKPAKCEWCSGEPIEVHDLYNYEGDNVCQGCLEGEEYEEPEIGLMPEEGNS